MKKIVAIGGGEIGRPGFPVETTKIDKEIIKLSGKKHPRILFLPTASSDSSGYVDVFNKHFGQSLGCDVDVLLLLNNKTSKGVIKEKIFGADIIYVGGGDTLKMLTTWKKFGVDKLLLKAYKKGIILSGLSAGSICWFVSGLSDSDRFKNPKADLKIVSGLGLIDAIHSPHHDVEKNRKNDLKKLLKNIPEKLAIAMDNCVAMEIVDDKFRIIDSKKSANAYKVYWKDGLYHEEEIEKSKHFQPISKLLKNHLT